MFLFGDPDIEGMKQKHNLKGLIKALSHKKATVRTNAAKALGDLCDAYAVGALIDVLQDDEDVGVCIAAVHALGRIRDPQAIKPMMSALHHAQPSVRTATVEVLPLFGGRQIHQPLIASLADDHEGVRKAAVQALTTLGEPVIESLIVALHLPNEHTRRGAMTILNNLGTPAIDALTAALLRETGDRRRTIALALDQTRWQPDATPVGAAYWIAKGEFEKCAAIGAPAVEPLAGLIQDENTDRRKAAVAALVKIGVAAIEPLSKMLQDHHDDPELRTVIVWVLGHIGHPDAIPYLIDALRDLDPHVHRTAVTSLAHFGESAIPLLTDALHHEHGEVCWGASQALDKIGWKPRLDTTGAWYCIVKGNWHACAKIGMPAVDPLIQTLNHWDNQVREKAGWTLEQIGKPALDPLINALQHADDDLIRINVASVLGRIGDERARQPLTDILSDENKDLTKSAYDALVAIDYANARA